MKEGRKKVAKKGRKEGRERENEVGRNLRLIGTA